MPLLSRNHSAASTLSMCLKSGRSLSAPSEHLAALALEHAGMPQAQHVVFSKLSLNRCTGHTSMFTGEDVEAHWPCMSTPLHAQGNTC